MRATLARRRLAVPLAAAVALIAGVAVVQVALLGVDDARGRTAAAGRDTVAIARRTLVDRETVDGTLGYAGSRAVIHRLAGATGAAGTLTAAAPAGSIVRRGGVLYRVDTEPVVLMYGSTPAYRELRDGVSDGRDVRQLEENLAALGFDPGVVDESFTSTTAAAVGDWQETMVLEETGAVELGRIVFLPGPRRVGERKAPLGSVVPAGSEVLETSSRKRVVTVELDAGLQSIARKGESVEVTLPSGATVRGRVSAVGRVAREQAGSGDGRTARASS